MVGAVFVTAGGDADEVRAKLAEHRWGIVIRWHPKPRSGRVGAILLDVTDTNELRKRILLIDARVKVSDRPHADDADA
jgi:hypothetical protein